MIERKKYSKKIMSIILAASMTVSLAACGGKNNTDTLQPETQESVQTEINTETPAEPETDTAQESASKYTVTGENDNKELTMTRQPEASYWFPAQLLEWNADEDEDLIFNISTVPLAERADLALLDPVNATQNKDTKVMSISIMNGSTSGNSPHGLNKAEANAFTYWQYVGRVFRRRLNCCAESRYRGRRPQKRREGDWNRVYAAGSARRQNRVA